MIKLRKSGTRGHRLLQALTLILISVSLYAMADTPKPDIPKTARGIQCVEETDFMRKNHMELLMHQRDETMHRGIRTKKHSLKECLDCHVVKGDDNLPVTAEDPRHFCSACHRYAAVKVDCFQCHSSVPEEKTTTLGMDVEITDIQGISE